MKTIAMHVSTLIIVACSGPGAMATIQQNIVVGYIGAGIGALITGWMAWNSLITQSARLPMILATTLLIVHPAWTVSAIRGDCGFMKFAASVIATFAFCGLFVWHWAANSKTVENSSKDE